MTRKGFIIWSPGTDRHWTGMQARRFFVQPGPKLEHWNDPFTYRGKEYRLRYVDGCFHPFVFPTDARIPSFV